jgi:AraC-like DNA-binding protein
VDCANLIHVALHARCCDARLLKSNNLGEVSEMIYREHTPCAPLYEFIERFWQCSDAPSHRRERILPSGTFELVINLREDEIRIYDPLRPENCRRLSGAVVSGPYGSCFLIDPQQHASIVAVHFRPSGASPFLGAAAHEFADTHVDLADAWGPLALELRERLCAVPIAQRFATLEEVLLSRLFRSPRRHRAVAMALAQFAQTKGAVRIDDVSRRLGLSQRRFAEVFSEEVGLTPKRYCRVQRFQHAREIVRNNAAPDWAKVAVDCGYCDQAHLIHEFQLLTGMTPKDYIRQRSERVLMNHVPHAE